MALIEDTSSSLTPSPFLATLLGQHPSRWAQTQTLSQVTEDWNLNEAEQEEGRNLGL